MLKGIFYKLYIVFKRLNLDSTPEYTALCVLAMLATINILSISFYGKLFLGFSKLDYPIWPSLLILAGVLFFLYVQLVKNKMYRKIFDKYRTLKKWNGWTGGVITIVYILFSILLFVSSIWVK